MERKAYSTEVSDDGGALVTPDLPLMMEDAPQRDHSLFMDAFYTFIAFAVWALHVV